MQIGEHFLNTRERLLMQGVSNMIRRQSKRVPIGQWVELANCYKLKKNAKTSMMCTTFSKRERDVARIGTNQIKRRVNVHQLQQRLQ